MSLMIENLTFSFGAIKVIEELSITLQPGTTSALIGASGSGKTTFLKLIAKLLPLSEGRINIEGNCSYLMQEDTLLPWRTVWEHLTLILELQNKEIDRSLLQELLHLLNLEGSENKLPYQLSGGMKRRVSLAQAILREHSLLLMDEPFSSLDIHTREHLFQLLKSIQKKNGSTLLIVTHDYRDAITIADEILWLSNGSIKSRWNITEEIRKDPSQTGQLLHKIRNRTCVPIQQ